MDSFNNMEELKAFEFGGTPYGTIPSEDNTLLLGGNS